jgi:predicted lactoylglutathione lyase
MEQSRRNWLFRTGLAFVAIALTKMKTFASPSKPINHQISNMKLGAFSISLTVKDLSASKLFYEKLGFKASGGDEKKNYVIMKNENALIGLFHGMFEKNILTFNPGWDENANKLEKFEDVRDIQRNLKSNGIKFQLEADEKTAGPAYLMIADPDGNQILIDQHV